MFIYTHIYIYTYIHCGYICPLPKYVHRHIHACMHAYLPTAKYACLLDARSVLVSLCRLLTDRHGNGRGCSTWGPVILESSASFAWRAHPTHAAIYHCKRKQGHRTASSWARDPSSRLPWEPVAAIPRKSLTESRRGAMKGAREKPTGDVRRVCRAAIGYILQ